MNQSLDEDLLPDPKDEPDLSKRRLRRAIIYLLIMLLGQVLIEYWFTRSLSIYSIYFVFTGVLYPLLVSAGLEAYRWWRHRKKEQRFGQSIPRDPFWFQLIEGGLAIWLLFLVAILIRLFLL